MANEIDPKTNSFNVLDLGNGVSMRQVGGTLMVTQGAAEAAVQAAAVLGGDIIAIGVSSALSTGAVTVELPGILETDRVLPFRAVLGGTPGHIYSDPADITVEPAEGENPAVEEFIIKSTEALDTSTVLYVVVRPS